VLDARSCEQEALIPEIVYYERNDLDLSYRHSRFRASRRVQFDGSGFPVAAERHLIEPAEIIMRMGIRLRRGDARQLRATIEVFKNPVGHHAGRLIEEAGLKGMRHGGAQISERHANFIINVGGARAADIAALIKEAHDRVLERFGIALEMEVELRGEWEV
jgi:UDP-N-acetylmuramate dehydrogenase